MTEAIIIYAAEPGEVLPIPYFEQGIACGFPSPADDFVEQSLDLNQYMVQRPGSTFYARARGNSMKDAGISDGDILIIDKSLQPGHGDIAVCWIDGQFTVKRIAIDKGDIWLVPENDEYVPIKVSEGSELSVWGIVIGVVKKFPKCSA